MYLPINFEVLVHKICIWLLSYVNNELVTFIDMIQRFEWFDFVTMCM